MFTVKATYNNETRRFTIQESSFPSFETIQNQLYRVFPIRGSYYLSRLMFCPSEGSRVVVGKEVHNEAQYNEHIAPFSGRLWPNGLLRFNVVDEIPHKPPFAASIAQAPSDSPFTSRLARPIPRRPPPPTTGSSTNMEVDDEWTATAGSNRHSMYSQSSRQSCCSVAESKEEVKELMSNFLRDFNNVMSSTFGEAPAPAPAPQVAPVPASPETVVPEQKNADEVGDVTIPGAFVQPAASSNTPEPVEKPVHIDISCDSCGNIVRGVRFKCQKCPDFDLCEECVLHRNARAIHQVQHAEREGLRLHSFSEIAKPGDPIVVPSEDLRDVHTPELPIHLGVICDLCNETIVGTRHKCLDCQDFDLCDTCISRRDAEHPRHQFVSIKTPGRIVVHRVWDGDETPGVNQPSPPANAVHHANCDLCDSRIRGIRYKCLSCPDYDVCSSCYSIVPDQHPKHTFVRLEAPQDLSPRDPSTYRRHGARCNECGATIRGVRYKCLHPECPDYDLCSKCEALPIEVHPSLHPLVKLRSPDVVIPTVYRIGGTTLIERQAPQVETAAIAIGTDPAPEKTDASVHVEDTTEKTDAAVATSSVVDETEAIERSVLMPVLPTPPPFAPGTSTQTLQHFADIWRDESSKIYESRKEPTRETAQTHADFPTFPSLLSAFVAKHAARQNNTLRATFVEDANVEDGQLFPAGAEFVKCWRMRNDGESDWPESTCVIFVAGDRMPAFEDTPLSYHVGKVEKGAMVDINAYDMKAPEVPGKYVGYWRLSDGTEPFGQSVWCEISVAIPSGPSSTHESLTASEVVMPELSHMRAASIDQGGEEVVPDLVPSTSVPATPTMSGPSTDVDSADSLLDDFDTASDEDWDAALREVSGRRISPTDAEYVVLYDEQSTDDDEGH